MNADILYIHLDTMCMCTVRSYRYMYIHNTEIYTSEKEVETQRFSSLNKKEKLVEYMCQAKCVLGKSPPQQLQYNWLLGFCFCKYVHGLLSTARAVLTNLY